MVVLGLEIHLLKLVLYPCRFPYLLAAFPLQHKERQRDYLVVDMQLLPLEAQQLLRLQKLLLLSLPLELNTLSSPL